ncbi:MAG: TlpA family protein disulfide reductase [Proteobacteria bacterium]|nr:TlpA family protein disulfide reductase [Pseudomonadota bacterium]MDA1354722.1 TlpA family protein disulfide reductase [Pseudomonadota bacterium]
MQISHLFAPFIPRWPSVVLAIALLFAAPLGGMAAQSLIDLDTRADGSRILNMVVHDAARPLPAFKFVDVAGNHLSIEDFRGKVVALHFWATWCMPCRAEMPTVDAMQELLGGEDFTFVPLSVDRKGAKLVQQYYVDHGLTNMPLYIDEGMDAAHALRVNGLPYTILLNRDGQEIARIIGDRDWSTPDATALMQRLIE